MTINTFINFISQSFARHTSLLGVLLFHVLATFYFWVDSQDLSLHTIENGIFGVATADGIDVGKRLLVYKLSPVVLLLSVVLYAPILAFLSRLFSRSPGIWKQLGAIGVAGIFVLFFQVVGKFHVDVVWIIYAMQFSMLFLAFLRQALWGSAPYSTREISTMIIASAALTVVADIIAGFNGRQLFGNSFNITFIYIFLLLTGALFLWSKFSSRYPSGGIVEIISPLVFLIWVSPMAQEAYMVLNQNGINLIGPKPLFLFGCALILLVVVYRAWKMSPVRYGSHKIGHGLFPAFIVGIHMLGYWPTVEISREMFEMANTANSILRFFEFGELPFLDYLSSHVLSDQLFSFSYFLFNDWTGDLGFLAYENILFKLFFYYFSYRFLFFYTGNPYFALAIALLFPFQDILFPAYFAFVFPGVWCAAHYLKQPGLKRLLLWIGSAIMIVFWRLDLGLAFGIASTILLILFILAHQNFLYLKQAIQAGWIFVVFCMLSFAVAWFVHPSITSYLRDALDYFGAHQAHAYTTLTREVDIDFYAHYFFLPLILFGIFLFLAVKWTMGKASLLWVGPILLLFLFYFANYPRGLVRHSLVEYTDTYVSSVLFFLFFISGYRLLPFTKRKSLLASLVMVVILIFAFHVQWPPLNYKPALATFIQHYRDGGFIEHSSSKIQRISNEGDTDKEFAELKQFIDTHFEPSETFIDLTGRPMTYFYCKRKVPSYFNQYLMNLLTDSLQERNVQYLKSIAPPVVLYANLPDPVWNTFDGIPNTLRFRPIYKYVHKMYKPYAVMSNVSVWLRNDILLDNHPTLDSAIAVSEKPAVEHLELIPRLLSNSLEWKDYQKLSEVKVIGDTVNFNKAIESVFVHLKLERGEGHNNQLKVNLFDRGNEIGTIYFRVLPGLNSYLLPISHPYNWSISTKPAVVFFPEENKVMISSLEILQKK